MQALLKQQRKSYLDLARIIGALAVVMVHVSADFVVYSPKGTLGYTAGCIFDAVSRIGVTFFVMISGVLMLDEEKELPALAPYKIERASYLDGCKIFLEGGGWAIVRFSGTEPILRVFCEMDCKEDADRICTMIKNHFNL